MAKYVKATMGDRECEIPLEDYLEIRAHSYGYDSYEELKSAGMTIDLDPESIVEKELTSKEKVNALVNSIPAKIRESIFESGKYEEYLHAMAHFTSRSINNNILIYSQRPDATLVEGFTKWKQLGRSVNPGAKGIQVIEPSPYKKKVEVPIEDEAGNPVIGYDGKPLTHTEEKKMMGYKIGYVFDVSDTHGKPLPTLAIKLESEEDYSQLLDVVRKVSPVPILTEAMNGSQNGFYAINTNDIHISDSLSEIMKLKTTIHELSHYYLHNNTDGIDRDADRSTKEVEAESCAYAVCYYYGIDTSDYSFGYVAGWAHDKELKALKESLDAIKITVGKLTTAIDQELQHRALAEQSNLTYHIPDGYLTVEKQNDMYFYKIFDRFGRDVDMGYMASAGCTIDEAATAVLQKEGKNPAYARICDPAELLEKMEKVKEQMQEAVQEAAEEFLQNRSLHH